ncbi:protein kinase [Archangium violaceum]|uniref:serine/threonine-protein kinase n=1 Tax=Archangium violaceum TaxID=83451 RepID=UPI0019517960|nr:serine/threonine-protein kinase [Archangium violaceum]QRO01881.1 protein kinase [Archangium violaceum]
MALTDTFEAELRMALAEGLLSQGEVDALREEARRLERSPLELLREKGRLSEETLVRLMAQAREAKAPGARYAEETVTIEKPQARPAPEPAVAELGHQETTATSDGLTARREPVPDAPAFPVPNWDRYQPVRFLGQGGMGRVFLAYDPRLRRNVALKFVRNEDSEHTRRFISEARSQARVNHERVCKVYEVGEVQGRVFIAMQYIDGQPLSALARELSVEQKAMLLRESALAVHEAHRVGLIHRDLKPSNIMVERGEDGVLKPYVMDFGLARDWTEQGTADGTVLGTPHYMAPEQARGEIATMDRRADVYSLGATLYALLTGAPPIPGNNGLEVVNRIATEEPRPPRALNPDLPADLEAITLKCLEKDRSARYDSARALAEDLERFLSGEPVQARAAGLGYRLRKKLRKHRAMVTVASVALSLVVLALGWAGLQRREVNQRERLARRFTELVEHVEAMARYSGLSPLHDIRADRQDIRAKMTELEAEIQRAGPLAMGPGQYALGRGMLALGDEVKAREHLEAAWAHGFREPRAAYALALVMGRIYQAQLLEVERLRNPEQREARRRDIERRYRDPAIGFLRQSQGAGVPSSRYVDALLAFYEDRLEEALGHLDAIGGGTPWFYEFPQLRGDILVARASRRWNTGQREAALADFEAGRKAYATAAAIGESVPSVSQSQGELEYAELVMELYSQGNLKAPLTRGLAAVARALTADPDHYESKVLEARFHRRVAEDLIGRGEAAEEPLQKAIAAAQAASSVAPARPQARLELGNTWSQWAQYRTRLGQDPREQFGKALDSFASLPPEDRDATFHMHLGLVHKGWADYEELVGLDTQAHMGKAIEAYLAALQLDERMTNAWINLGIAYLKRSATPRSNDPDGDLEKARTALDKARALNPKHVVAYFYAAQLQEQLAARLSLHGKDPLPAFDMAIDLYQQGIALNPGLPYFHNGAGAAFFRKGAEVWSRGGDPFPLFDQAQAAFERAVALGPSDASVHNNLGTLQVARAQYQLALGREPAASVRVAAESYRKALGLVPDEPLYRANLGKALGLQAAIELERGREPGAAIPKAMEAIQGALKQNAQLGRAWLYVGEMLEIRARWRALQRTARREDFDEAAAAFQKAIDLEPEYQEYQLAFARFCRWWALWQAREKVGMPNPALTRGFSLVEGLLASRPEWPEVRALRAGLLLIQAETESRASEQVQLRDRAREDFRQALTVNPNLEHAWKDSIELARSAVRP